MFFINILFHLLGRKSIPLCYKMLHQLSNVAVLPGQYSIHTILDPWLEYNYVEPIFELKITQDN